MRWRRLRGGVESWLEAERDQLPLWLPVMLGVGVGVTAWFALPHQVQWIATMLAGLALAAAALAIGCGGRAAAALAVAGLAIALGVALAWWRAERVAQPVLARPAIVSLRARVDRVEPLPARELVRLRVAPLKLLPRAPDPAAAKRRGRPRPPVVLPPHIRINLAKADVPAGLSRGAMIELSARLMPPQGAGVPGAYDYSRLAWFDGIGASGKAFAPVKLVTEPVVADDGLRTRLTRFIVSKLPGSQGGVAAAFVTGDVGAISLDDADAMRRAGLAHLLSISGLHISAAVAATMLVLKRLFALSRRLALSGWVPVLAAGGGAVAAIGYTWLSGAEVPTIRSCVASLLVLGALALGREAVTLRLVAAGATLVLLLWPESLAGPSFQLSFAAVTAIVALHEHPRAKAWFMKRDERWWRAVGREGASLLATGFLVELALMPIAVFHFHKAGVYGAFANIVAIPLSTFVIMPAEALALAFDLVGLGGPFWWATGRAVALLLWISRVVAHAPGAVTVLPTMPDAAFALMVGGGLWLALWRTRWRRLGLAPLAAGAVWALLIAPPDLLVTGDGRHVAVRTPTGIAFLRDRTSDYTQDMLTVNAGFEGTPDLLSERPDARCSRDLCLATRRTGGRLWRILATRSGYQLPAPEFIALCGKVDIVVSDRRLPKKCVPRWLLLTPKTLAQTGGIALTLSTGRLQTVLTPGDEHPWALARVLAPPATRPAFSRSGAGGRKAYPGRAPEPAHTVGDHRHDSRDRAGSLRPRDGNT